MTKITTRKALNPAYRKHKPLRNDVTTFIQKLNECIAAIKLSDENGESEEHIKSHFKDFFTNTFYRDNYINTKDRIDLAIYLDNTAKSDIGVIIEAKKPSNKAEFISENNLNKKALQELLLYYLRERLDGKNNNIKHLIATNGYEWFLFKAEDFYNYFYKNKALIKEYEAFRDGLKDTTKNELFYTEIAKKYIEEVKEELPFVHLDFSTVNLNALDDNKLNTYFKIFSNVHLLGHSFGNDSNQLNKNFYHELLHIIGLEEVADGGKKVIQRKDTKVRDYASLLENTIFTLEDRDYLRNVKSVENTIDKAFNVGLELCLTWINRILFLKLLESQLATYHNNAKEYRFLNSDFNDGFDALNNLFFSALAKKVDERHPKYADKFKYIPYLNSSLFERNELENETFEISALNNDEMEVFPSTILKDSNGKRFKGKLKTLDYLFKFLDAYDFATDGTEGIVEGQETKTLINASVLGLIFEKINGYKDGSFYTPAYITMYMCKETIRRAVAQKFKEQENDTIENFDDVKAYSSRFFKADDSKRFNTLINSLRICDPAVGSGHFLVSALNELIVIKNELGILIDEKGIPLRVDIQIDNDELYISDAHGNLFEYNPNDAESTRIQKTLFEEKQTLIENCLFGVDINPNSVKICRLRLWIELLKNAYYNQTAISSLSPRAESRGELLALQTLPNIDINIKCGNSLISRFDLQDDLKDAFKGKDVKYNFTDYKKAVNDYKNSNSKEEKYQVLEIINEVKNNFKSTLDNKFIDKVSKAVGTYENEKQRLDNLALFGEKIKKAEKDKLKKLKADADKFAQEKEDTINNAIYNNAFEWRFEFPEVLDDSGAYIGFDAIIGNPPYITILLGKKQSYNLSESNFYKKSYNTFEYKGNTYVLFIERANNILKKSGFLSYIIPNTILLSDTYSFTRNFLLKNAKILKILNFEFKVFDEAEIGGTLILLIEKNCESVSNSIEAYNFKNYFYDNLNLSLINQELLKNIKLNKYYLDSHTINLLLKIGANSKKYGEIVKIYQGIITGDNKRFISENKLNNNYVEILRGKDVKPYSKEFSNNFLLFDKDLLWSNTDETNFQQEKLISRQTSDTLIATYDSNNYFTLDSTHVHTIIDSSYNLKFLLSLFNSKFLRYIYNLMVQEEGRVFAQVKTVVLKELMIKITSIENQQPFIEKAEQILTLKQENPVADTTTLEKEIDAMVYELYELTEDEITIVENS
ncbi:MAG: Eco57I restriction-modification methylase domain-containing protein [Bacteroidetes bacterium]|nr:Eco57I restriction-modification methylase domain-containing protein [Bacteroidota bacterium]